MNKKPLILITNDDSINSKGIQVLIEEMSKIGDLFILAPDSPNSGMGHAITVNSTLHTHKSKLYPNLDAYTCSGTPADCVKLAKHELLKDRTIDLVVSGINHGNNLSISVLYSGTMSAAIEAAVEGIPSIGFSLNDYSDDADFEHTRPYLLDIAKKVLEKGIPKHTSLNVNFPKNSDTGIKGIKVTRQAHGYWKEEFDARKDPYDRPYYWMGGYYVNREPNAQDHDVAAIMDGYISIVPCQYDMTDYKSLELLSF
ncbi:MAG: 5'/3'-nucleotidase SurE [Leadbetterella sp.]